MGIGNTRHRGGKGCRCGRVTCGICCPRNNPNNNRGPTGPQGIPGPTGPCCTGPAGAPGNVCKDFKWSGLVDATVEAIILSVGAVLADSGVLGIPSLPINPLFPYPAYPVHGPVCPRLCTTLVGGQDADGAPVAAVIVALAAGTNLHFQLIAVPPGASAPVTVLCESLLPIPTGIGISITDALTFCDDCGASVDLPEGTRIAYRILADGAITITGNLFVAATGG